jgi:hypothetical protein
MILPLFPRDAFGYETSLVVATALGFGFGFVLERSGFGRAPVLASQFYGGDNRVLKVKFSAIVTALLGVTLLSGAGVLDFGALAVPETFLWPQLVGGLLLGIGFIVSGYCPGTAVVATGSGNLDGAATLFGVAAGSLLFGVLWPLVGDFHGSGALGVVRLPDLLGVPDAVAAAAVLAMAAAAFFGVEGLERWLARRRGSAPPAGAPGTRNRVLAGLGAAAAAALFALALPVERPQPPAKGHGRVDALTLARRLVGDPASLHVVDLREAGACAKRRIPGALCAGSVDLAALAPTRALVVYGAGDLAELPPAVRGFAGRVEILAGGFAAFDDAVLRPPPAPRDPSVMAEHRLRAALHTRFTGAQVRAAPSPPPPPAQAVPAKKKAGGC